MHSGPNLFSTTTEGFTGTKTCRGGNELLMHFALENLQMLMKNFQATFSKSGPSTLLYGCFRVSRVVRTRGCKFTSGFCDLELAVDFSSKILTAFQHGVLYESTLFTGM